MNQFYRNSILKVLEDGKPRSRQEILEATKLHPDVVKVTLGLMVRKGDLYKGLLGYDGAWCEVGDYVKHQAWCLAEFAPTASAPLSQQS